jgi:very-short-patch-repair endonuclease
MCWGPRMSKRVRVVRKAPPSPTAKQLMARAKAAMRDRAFRDNLRAIGLGIFHMEAEHLFHPTRKWRFDYAWPSAKLALEVDGGVWSGGKHGRGSGIVKDHEKQCEAAVLGWRILRVQPKALLDPETAHLVYRCLTTLTTHP